MANRGRERAGTCFASRFSGHVVLKWHARISTVPVGNPHNSRKCQLFRSTHTSESFSKPFLDRKSVDFSQSYKLLKSLIEELLFRSFVLRNVAHARWRVDSNLTETAHLAV